MGIFDKNSTSNDKKRQHTSSADGGSSSIVDISDIKSKDTSISITDAGAIAGSVAVANNALRTAETITQSIGDQSSVALGSVNSLAKTFTGALESIKKTDLTGGSSLLFDTLKYWPIVPVAIGVVMVVKHWGKK